MSWTVACFCGTVFEDRADRCPTCHTPVLDVTIGAPAPAQPHRAAITAIRAVVPDPVGNDAYTRPISAPSSRLRET